MQSWTRMCSVEIKKKRVLTVGQRVRKGLVDKLSLSLGYTWNQVKIRGEEEKY